MKYTAAGLIRIDLIPDEKLRYRDGRVVPGIKITVSDPGVGIPAEDLKRIFEVFVESSRTASQAGGTGLGLAICREILNCHHGLIWAESNPDKGSTFVMMISYTQPKA